jgi:hypothetical protein
MPGGRLNDTERRLLERWRRPETLPSDTLLAISIDGNPGLRGIKKLEIDFKYPLSVICGRNGNGKTTVLAIAALGYHSVEGHVPRGAQLRAHGQRICAYYTFRDFFYKGPTDPDITGVNIKWVYARREPISITKRSEKWMHYERRPARAVHYLGVARALPAIEQSVLRSHFHSGRSYADSIELDADSISRLSSIMGRQYRAASELHSRHYSLRTCVSLPSYSSFNMGAGEDVLIDLLGIFQSVPNGSLVIIEEIELGLHPQALSRLALHIQEIIALKQLQVIVSTHSRDFVDAVPREARILIQAGQDEHALLYAPTTRFAMGQLSGRAEPEMCIYCEDAVAECIISRALSGEQRQRVKVQPVGDKAALAVQAISHVRAGDGMRHLVIWDGDVTENEVTGWLNRNRQHGDKVCYWFLPGNIDPELMVVRALDSENGYSAVADELELLSPATARQLVQDLAAVADPHDIPYEAEIKLNRDKYSAFDCLTKCAKSIDGSMFEEIRRCVGAVLDGTLVRGRM